MEDKTQDFHRAFFTFEVERDLDSIAESEDCLQQMAAELSQRNGSLGNLTIGIVSSLTLSAKNEMKSVTITYS